MFVMIVMGRTVWVRTCQSEYSKGKKKMFKIIIKGQHLNIVEVCVAHMLLNIVIIIGTLAAKLVKYIRLVYLIVSQIMFESIMFSSFSPSCPSTTLC